MSDKISRRDFLKLAGVGGAVATALTGCGPASRYVTRTPYYAMPEYNTNGQSTYYATLCRECAAGCGLVVRTMQGRALKVEGNKNNPVNLGKTCARGQATLQGLYNPDRIQNPVKLTRGTETFEEVTWDAAIATVAGALKNNRTSEVAFLMGLAPDHLFDLVNKAGLKPIRYGALSMFEARATLTEAARLIFGKPSLLFFDMAGSDVTFSFGANFLETWISPVAYTRGFSKMRQGMKGRRGYLVQFEPRMSQTAMVADEWIPVKPGTEGFVALALGRLIAELRGTLPQIFLNVNVDEAAEMAGVEKGTLERLARIYANAEHPLALPGGAALSHTNGLDSAQAILALNALAGNIGQPGGVFITPGVGVDEYHRPASVQEISALIDKMSKGEIKVLFVHGVNPIFELPSKLGFAEALKNVPTVISFSSFPDETALQSDYIFPDHTPFEAWGYQRAWVGGDRAVLTGAQPVVAPLYNTRATVDVLLAAAQAVGGNLAALLPSADEVAFIESQVTGLLAQGGFYSAPDPKTFMAQFQQYGGWWKGEAELESPTTRILDSTLKMNPPQFSGEGEFYLHVYPSPVLGDGAGANRPVLQETPDPATTVMWNTWVEINTQKAEEMGIESDDVVLITTPFGAIEATVYKYPAIRPDTIAIPFGQGHTALGRYATIEDENKKGFDLTTIWPGSKFDPTGEGLLGNKPRGANPADLFGPSFNAAGDLTFGAFKVKLEKIGSQRVLARKEGRLGVYGDGIRKEE